MHDAGSSHICCRNETQSIYQQLVSGKFASLAVCTETFASAGQNSEVSLKMDPNELACRLIYLSNCNSHHEPVGCARGAQDAQR